MTRAPKQHPEAESVHDLHAQQRLVERDQEDESEVHDHHRDRERDRHAPPRCGKGLQGQVSSTSHERETI